MSPSKRKAASPGVVTFTILGTEVTVDFDDRDLIRDILDLYKRLRALESADTDSVDSALVSLDMVAEADAILLRAVGQTARDAICGEGKARIFAPMRALVALVGPAGKAYDAIMSEYAALTDALPAD